MVILKEYNTYIDAFRSSAKKYAKKVAVMDEKSEISYGDLDSISDVLATKFILDGIKKGNRILLYVPRIKEAIVGIFAIWKAGATYVPVDSEYPEDRINYIIKDTDAKCICTIHELWDRKPLNIFREKVFFLDDLYDSKTDIDLSIFPKCNLDDEAYVIFTSGSTGKPKGVLHTQRSLFSLSNWQPDSEKSFNENCRFANLTNFSFIACITDLFSPLLCGGMTFIISNESKKDLKKVYDILCENKITNVHAPVRMAILLLENFDMRPFEVRMGGERVVPFRPLYQTTITQQYGSSEGCFTVTGKITGEENPIPLGKANNCIEYMIVDDDLKVVPKGEIGEFVYSGPILAKEYLNRPELNNEKWFMHEGKKWFKTGDLLREGENGLLYYIQRKDFMVKINGFRVELGEIENNVLLYDGVEEAVCVAREINGGIHLCLFYSGKDISQNDSNLIRESISKKLPDYMIPSFFIYIDHLPRNANGKIDRMSLPEIDPTELSREVYAKPENGLQKKICDSFAKVLGISAEKIGIDDSFFDLGGNSILVMKLLTLIDINGLTSMDIFKKRTVREISKAIEQKENIDKIDVDEKENAFRLLPQLLTKFQSKIYLDQLVKMDSTVWNVPSFFSLADSIDHNRLCSAINKVIGYHPVFSTVLNKTSDGKVVLQYNPKNQRLVEVEYLTENEFSEIRKDIVLTFEVYLKPLYNIRIFKTEKHIYLFIDVHHLLMDGTSLNIFMREIVKAYEGKEINNKDYFYTFLNEQNKILDTDEYKKAHDLCRNVYGDIKNWKRFPDRDFNEGDYNIKITGILPSGINIKDLEIAEQRFDTSRNVLAVVASLVAMYVQTKDKNVLVSWIYNNRNNSLYDNTIGSLVKELPVALRITEDISIINLIDEVKNQVIEGISNSACEYLAENYIPFETDTLFVNYLSGLRNYEVLSPLGATQLDFERKHDISKNSMGLAVFEEKDGNVFIGVEYCSGLYKHETALCYHTLFQNIFVKLVKYVKKETILDELIKEK